MPTVECSPARMKVSTSICAPPVSCTSSRMKPSRFLPASCLNFSSFADDGCSVAGVLGCWISCSLLAARCSLRAFFAFFRILTRSTMYRLLHEAVLARRGDDARGVDALGIVAEGLQKRGGGEGVDQARDAAAYDVDALHRVMVERVAR